MSTTRPNILLITTDQQRGDCLGIDPQAPTALQTPNLDWLGRRGANFHLDVYSGIELRSSERFSRTSQTA